MSAQPDALNGGDRSVPFKRGSVDWCRASFNAATALANLGAQLPQTQVEYFLQDGAGVEALPPGGPRNQILLLAGDVLGDMLVVLREDPEADYRTVARLPGAVLAAGITSMVLGANYSDGLESTVSEDWVVALLPRPPLEPGRVIPRMLNTAHALAVLARSKPLSDMDGEEWGIRAASIVDAVERQPALPQRARYNLACYYVGRRQFSRALAELSIAMPASPALMTWAQTDPTLRPLQQEYREEWSALFPPAPAPPSNGTAD